MQDFKLLARKAALVSLAAVFAVSGAAQAATTIGSNISTDGTLTVNGLTALNGSASLATTTADGLLTANSGLTVLGAVSLPAGSITNAMLSGSIAASKLIGTDIDVVGTIATGTWNGTVIGLAYGGTGGTDATSSRTNLGLAIGTDVQAYDADLTVYAGITPSANVQTLLGSADYAGFRTSLGLGSIVTYSSTDYLAIGGGTLTGGLEVGGNATSTGLYVNGNATITGTLNAASITFDTSNISNLNNLSVGGALTVTGTSTLTGNVGIGTTSPNVSLAVFDSFISGDSDNYIEEPGIDNGAILGGYSNRITTGNADNAVILGGSDNEVRAWGSVIIGGDHHLVTGDEAAVIGGYQNTISNLNSVILGGNSNTISGSDSVMVASNDSIISGSNSFVAGPYNNASANNAIILGRGIDALNKLVNNIADSLMVGFNSDIPTLFVGPSSGASTTGYVGIGTTTPGEKLVVNGNVIITGTLSAASITFNTQNITGVSELTVTGTTTLSNVGIGTTTDGLAKLTVATGGITGLKIASTGDTDTGLRVDSNQNAAFTGTLVEGELYGNGGQFMHFNKNGSEVFDLTHEGKMSLTTDNVSNGAINITQNYIEGGEFMYFAQGSSTYDGDAVYMNFGSSGSFIGNYLHFYNAGNEKFLLNSTGGAYFAGDVGIGTSTPEANLQVYGGDVATSTVEIGGSGSTNGACLKLRDYMAGGWTYCVTFAGTLSCSTTSCE